MKQCEFQNNYGTVDRKRFLVVHLYSSFSMDPLDFFLMGKFIPKIAIFCDFGGHKATFLKPQW